MRHNCSELVLLNKFQISNSVKISEIYYMTKQNSDYRLEYDKTSILINYCPFCGEKLELASKAAL
jgi:transcription initiation factor IIE alpha subunit